MASRGAVDIRKGQRPGRIGHIPISGNRVVWENDKSPVHAGYCIGRSAIVLHPKHGHLYRGCSGCIPADPERGEDDVPVTRPDDVVRICTLERHGTCRNLAPAVEPGKRRKLHRSDGSNVRVLDPDRDFELRESCRDLVQHDDAFPRLPGCRDRAVPCIDRCCSRWQADDQQNGEQDTNTRLSYRTSS
jgi:hypothetical protein